jgi:hypothetical protein
MASASAVLLPTEDEQHMIVTFDAFKGNSSDKDFIIKGLTVYNVTKNTIQHFEFAAPFEWNLLNTKARQDNYHVSKKVHGLQWYSGEIPHYRLLTVLKDKTDSISHVYAKGEEPTRFLRNMLGRDIHNLESAVMTHLTPAQLSSIIRSNNRIVMRCSADHSALDDITMPASVHNACCFTRALRLAEFLKAFLNEKQHQQFQHQQQEQLNDYYKIYHNQQQQQ